MPDGGPDGDLAMNHEVVTAVARDLAELRVALDEVLAYARADDLVPGQFGGLASQVGSPAAFAGVRDALRGSFERAVPVVEGMARALTDSARWVTEADAEAAMGITRAGER